MKLSDTLITAAAGLAGAIIGATAGLAGAFIGGIATYRANRTQWRRESRRTVYASLIGASYEIEALIAARLKVTEEVGKNSNIDTDLRTKFYVQLDSASLLATWETQGILREWRALSHYLDEFDKLDTGARTILYRAWKEGRTDFYNHAKEELGFEGKFRYRNALLPYILIALFIMTISVALGFNGPYGWLTIVGLQTIMVALLFVSACLLAFALQACWRWNSSAAGFDGPTGVLRTITETELSRFLSIATILLAAIAFALLCNVAALISAFYNVTVSSVITIVGGVVLIVGSSRQLIGGSETLRTPKKE